MGKYIDVTHIFGTSNDDMNFMQFRFATLLATNNTIYRLIHVIFKPFYEWEDWDISHF